MAEKSETLLHRQRLLYLIKILSEQTDEQHGLTIPQIITALEKYGIAADRKALYLDIAALNDFGIEIETGVGRSAEYHYIDREFSLAELKLLADAVTSAKFITARQSAKLLDKLGIHCSRYQKDLLKRNVFVTSRKCIDPTDGRNILINVDYINEAICTGKKISFKYFSYDCYKHKKYKNKNIRVVSPYNLVLNNEQYYMIGFVREEKDGEICDSIRNYRVDRMERITILDEDIQPRPKDYSVENRVDEAFSMFTGETREVKLKFTENLMSSVMDKFGTNVRVCDVSEEDELDENGRKKRSFTVRVNIMTSGPFYGWLFQFGKDAQIIAPADIRQEYLEHAQAVIASMQDKQIK